MRRALLLVPLVFVIGCAQSWKVSYITGSEVKEFTTESYDIYSEQFNLKIEKCHPSTNSLITTKTKFDECMGKGYNKNDHDKIESAVEVYHAEAKVHTAIMIAADPDSEDWVESTKNVLDSAVDLLELLPNGKSLVKKLNSLIGKK